MELEGKRAKREREQGWLRDSPRWFASDRA
uniref:Uncharacterized protein n=1 Tax=Arundo donax TaxID=35708 RepID=A0A0A8ZGH3_ARUDO